MRKRRVTIPSSWLEAVPEAGLKPLLWRDIKERVRRKGIRHKQVDKVRAVALQVIEERERTVRMLTFSEETPDLQLVVR